jgi:hypothetical protein
MRITHVNATPRSKIFKYYSTSGVQGGNNSTSNIYNPPHIEIDNKDIIQLNVIGDGNVISNIDNNQDDLTILDITKSNAVTKIIPGTNVTVTPTTGIGDVTINSKTTINYTQSGSGNSITALSYNNNNATLSSTLGYRMTSLTTSGSGNVVGSLSYSNGTLTQNMTNIASSGGNVVSNLPSGYSAIKMYRHTILQTPEITVPPNAWYDYTSISASSIGMTQILNAFPSVMLSTSANIQISFTLAIIISGTSINLRIFNPSSNTAYMPANTTINCLIFGI